MTTTTAMTTTTTFGGCERKVINFLTVKIIPRAILLVDNNRNIMRVFFSFASLCSFAPFERYAINVVIDF